MQRFIYQLSQSSFTYVSIENCRGLNDDIVRRQGVLYAQFVCHFPASTIKVLTACIAIFDELMLITLPL
jgi:hypothetical protein